MPTQNSGQHVIHFSSTTHRRSPVALCGPLDNYVNGLMKRMLDVAIALPIVMIVLPLLCVLTKLGQWLQSPGPLFFCQTRNGREGVPFRVIKFRTLHVPQPGISELDDNLAPREFPFGQFLRRSRIDEIPQFINVLLGTMSIVGPRPHHEQDRRNFSRINPSYPLRLAAKPGITGLAQYDEYRGAFQYNCVASRLRRDLDYISRWSLVLDVVLIVKTSRVIVTAMWPDFLSQRFTGAAFEPLTPRTPTRHSERDWRVQADDAAAGRQLQKV